ncbi:MAG: hypothetical protein K0M69_18125, partial [Youngiibacter sp.]|nr:hypothetical protein [Youngiibacter sp.]
DIDAGFVYNMAIADSDESEPDEDDHNELLPQYPGLTLEKSGPWVDGVADGMADPGELINYTFTVTNTGNVTLHNVTVTDPKVTVVGGPTTLDIGEVDSTTFTGSYAITQADIDAGSVYNMATADSDESEPDDDDHTEPLAQTPGLSLEKSGAWVDGDGDGYTDVGELINYTFTVTNTGNVTLHNVTVTDPKVTVVGGPTTLDVGETDSTTFTGSYQVTLADIVAGSVYNIATADSNETPPVTDDVTVNLVAPPDSTAWVANSTDPGTILYAPGKGWATYVAYKYNDPPKTVAAFTGQTTRVGTVTFTSVATGVRIDITLNGYEFQDGGVVNIQGYTKTPAKKNPAPGSFEYQIPASGTSFSFTVPGVKYLYYGVHMMVHKSINGSVSTVTLMQEEVAVEVSPGSIIESDTTNIIESMEEPNLSQLPVEEITEEIPQIELPPDEELPIEVTPADELPVEESPTEEPSVEQQPPIEENPSNGNGNGNTKPPNPNKK